MFDCAFIHAVQRQFHSRYAIFARTVAYVDLVMANNERKVYRFLMSEAAKRIIRAFDKTKTPAERAKLAEEAGNNFTLRAPPKTSTLEHKVEAGRKGRKTQKYKDYVKRRHLIIKGTAECVPASKRKKPSEKPINEERATTILTIDSDIRSAKGKVSFRASKVRPSRIKDIEEVTA